jgi:hypothetical protein
MALRQLQDHHRTHIGGMILRESMYIPYAYIDGQVVFDSVNHQLMRRRLTPWVPERCAAVLGVTCAGAYSPAVYRRRRG